MFSAGGKRSAKKDLGEMVMNYGHVYVAQVAMGYSDAQTVKALAEAESYDGPSLVIAYSHCVGQGFDLGKEGYEHQRLAVETGAWTCYRFDPRLATEGRNPLQIDSKAISRPIQDYVQTENRFNMLSKAGPGRARMLWDAAQRQACTRWQILKQQAEITYDETCPFEAGKVDEHALAAAGAESVTGVSTGPNMPVSGRRPADAEDGD